MSFLDAVKHCLIRYAAFHGRAARPEFWWFALFSVLTPCVAGLFSDPLSMALLLALLAPSFAVGARRLHDTGRSGWWQALWLLPLLGWLPLIYWFCQPGPPADAQ